MQNLDETVLSQYANDPVTDALVASFGQAINPSYLFEQFYNLIWNALAGDPAFINPSSTQSYGLDVWGRIVGVNRIVSIGAGPLFLGFKSSVGASGVDFDFGIFYKGESPEILNFTLTNQAYLHLILAKAAANITNGSTAAFNNILLTLFPNRGRCYVQDNNNMTMAIIFDFPLQPFEKAIVMNSGALPTPAGIIVSYSIP